MAPPTSNTQNTDLDHLAPIIEKFIQFNSIAVQGLAAIFHAKQNQSIIKDYSLDEALANLDTMFHLNSRKGPAFLSNHHQPHSHEPKATPRT